MLITANEINSPLVYFSSMNGGKQKIKPPSGFPRWGKPSAHSPRFSKSLINCKLAFAFSFLKPAQLFKINHINEINTPLQATVI